MTLISIDVNPKSAFVCVPSGGARSSGRARNARNASEYPSSNSSLGRFFAIGARLLWPSYNPVVATSPDLRDLNPASKEYLEAIFELGEEGQKILQARVGERLGLAP